MKRIIALLSAVLLLTTLLGSVSISAQDTLDDHLISHWDFVGTGDDALADKAPAGSSSDTMKLYGSSTAGDGTAYIPDWKNANSDHYIYAEDSEDLLRTTADRTIFIVFKSSHANFADDGKTDRMELAAQNGAFRLGINDSNLLFGSTNPHSMGENSCVTTGMNGYVPDTWITVAVSYDKTAGSSSFVVTTFFRVGDGDWIECSTTRTDATQTWTEDNSDSGQSDPNSLIFGRRANASASTWGGNITIDDIRIYDKPLTLAEVSSIQVGNDKIVSGGHSLTLAGDIGVNFFIKPNTATVRDNSSVVISNGSTELLNATFSEGFYATEKTGYYKFTANIAAKEMADELTLSVKDGDSVLYTDTYSATTYAEYIISNSDAYSAETVELVKAMLNYGGYAQEYFGYNTESLANKNLSLALGTITKSDEYASEITGSVTGVTFDSATLVLETKTEILYKLILADGVSDSDITVTGAEVVSKEGNTLILKSDGICAHGLGTPNVLTIGKGTETMTVSYSPMTYIMNMSTNTGTTLDNVLRALYAYYEAAAAYVASI
ncbi:MAG: hypothetical protein ACI3XQ_12410 [Eubacteriales bacterium]